MLVFVLLLQDETQRNLQQQQHTPQRRAAAAWRSYKYQKVYDGRKRRIRGQWNRGSRGYFKWPSLSILDHSHYQLKKGPILAMTPSMVERFQLRF